MDVRDEILYTGQRTGPIVDEASGDNVYHAVMDGLPESSPYAIEVDGLGHSHPFQVGHDVYSNLRDGLLKFLYFQRCGTELTPEYAGVFANGACHLDEGTVYDKPNRRLPSHGGWHDAGDHGKYIVPAAKTIADLLPAYELFPSLSTRPNADDGDLVFCPVSYTATATLAASMAMAARIYAPIDAAFANQCLASAELAWHWLTTEAEAVSFRNPPDILTAEYGDPFVMDDKFWAASELFRTTRQSAYHDAVMELLTQKLSFTGLGWADVSGFGSNLLLHPHHRPSVGDNVTLPVPGMVSGGPNQNLQDEIAKKMLTGQPTARCFIDHDDSYSTNEVTIYWNSPAVFVAAYLTQA